MILEGLKGSVIMEFPFITTIILGAKVRILINFFTFYNFTILIEKLFAIEDVEFIT